MTDLELKSRAEEALPELSGGLQQFCTLAERYLELQKDPSDLRARSKAHSNDFALGKAILAELHSLLCTNSVYYRDLREKGKLLTHSAASAVAGAAASGLGLPAAAAIAATYCLGGVVLRVGARALCAAMSEGKKGS